MTDLDDATLAGAALDLSKESRDVVIATPIRRLAAAAAAVPRSSVDGGARAGSVASKACATPPELGLVTIHRPFGPVIRIPVLVLAIVLALPSISSCLFW